MAKENFLAPGPKQSDFDTLSSTVTTLNSKFTTKDSGSLHDITTSGVYYLRNSVTDKPTSTGGSYVVSEYNGTVTGIFTQTSTGNVYSVTNAGGTWTTTLLAQNDKKVNLIQSGSFYSNHPISITVEYGHAYLLVWGTVGAGAVYILTAQNAGSPIEVSKSDTYASVSASQSGNNTTYTFTCSSGTARPYFIIGV